MVENVEGNPGVIDMFRKFASNRNGNYAIATAVLLVPLLGAVGVGVDFSNLTRQKYAVMNALDAAGIATGRRSAEGASDEELVQYARDFFDANLGPIAPQDVTLYVTLPNSDVGGGLLTLHAELDYHPLFLPLLSAFTTSDMTKVVLQTEARIRLKNSSEIALVLDNSGSMRQYGSGTSKTRIDLLKEAATYLVNELAASGARMKNIDKPVQFSVVPFSATVNVGPDKDQASWMDTQGISPVHHENFDWSQMTEANAASNGNRWVQKVGDIYYKRGTGWTYTESDGTVVNTENQPVTRFSMYDDMRVQSGREAVSTEREYVCTRYRRNGQCRSGYWSTSTTYVYTESRYASWQGCVEARPYPYDGNDAAPSTSDPATLFVPALAPDEPGNIWLDTNGDGINDLSSSYGYNYANNWWTDYNDGASGTVRQGGMPKYFKVKPFGSSTASGSRGPNYSCTTAPITPLQDVTTAGGLSTVINSISAMEPTGMTNVSEGIAWGWRTVSSPEPFTEGRSEAEKGNDKVLIVLTDGENTYSDIYNDDYYAGNQSTYAAYGYTGKGYNGGSTARMFLGTSGSVGKYNYSSSNYTKALDEHMKHVCDNAKGGGVIIFSVGLDLSASSSAIPALKDCASESRFSKEADGSAKKLFYNTTGGDLLEVFKVIAEELSNLRVVG